MLCVQEGWILILVKFLFILTSRHASAFLQSNYHFPDQEQENFIKTHKEFDVVHPVKVDWDGVFVSHSLTHHINKPRRKRDARKTDTRVYYKIHHKGQDLLFNLTVNPNLLSHGYVLEKRYGKLTGAKMQPHSENSCHLVGTVTSWKQVDKDIGSAAVSTCSGLNGFFRLSKGHYFIEAIRNYHQEEGAQHPHVIYRRHFPQSTHRQRRDTDSGGKMTCGLKDSTSDFLKVERQRESWERKHRNNHRRISQRSVSKERWVETLVVADSKMIEYHGSENVESYVFTIMNMVAGIFHDPSIGNAVHIVLVRIILLEEEEKGLKIVHHADSTLSSFCKWQKNINPKSDTHPAHHDVAVLITRKDLCAGKNQPCETLGLSHLSGLCQPHRSCNINEDSGLPVAFTVAHELGHSFSIHHDGQGNDCEPVGRHPFIMSRQLQYDPSPLTWSHCSKEYITRFLDRGWGSCLDDRPSKKVLTAPIVAPGVLYDIHQQCQLQYGPNTTFCDEVENVCQTLWCSVNGSCRSKLDAAADGTWCGKEKWCLSGECVVVGKRPDKTNGKWGMWSSWSHCTRTCGAGIQSAERQCNNPQPQFGGKYCTGERRRYRICNTKACARDRPTFREMQCSEFNTVPYNNELYEWIPVTNTLNPCELHCRPVDGQFSEKMLDAVIDGTSCFDDDNSRNICVNSVCKDVGCDYAIDSNAIEDRCGVCLGDGSGCQTVTKMFDASEGLGYVDVGLIPKGARDIVVKEVKESGNFLALRSEDPEKYYLNGQFIIQWNGEYKAAGTTFFYERSGNLENLTSPGPTKEPVWLQLLFQERNLGVKYEYTIQKHQKKENEVGEPEYIWKYGAWTDCTATCGTGVQRQPVRCIEKWSGVVEETFCNPDTRPEGRQKRCKNQDCPARWWVGEWQACSMTCGPAGLKKRTVFCIRTVGAEEQALPPSECRHLLKPKPQVPCNRDVLCSSHWTVDDWSECSATCGGGIRTRGVTCPSTAKEACDISKKPNSKSLCGLQNCLSDKNYPSPLFPKIRRIVHESLPRNPSQKPIGAPSGKMIWPKPTRNNLTITTTGRPFHTTQPATVATSFIQYSVGTIAKDNLGGEDYDYNFITFDNSSTTKSPRPLSSKPPNPSLKDKMLKNLTPGYDYITDDATFVSGEVDGTPEENTSPSDYYKTTDPSLPSARNSVDASPSYRVTSTRKPANKLDHKRMPSTTTGVPVTTQIIHPNAEMTKSNHTNVTAFPKVKVLKAKPRNTADQGESTTTIQIPEGYSATQGDFFTITTDNKNFDTNDHLKDYAFWVVGNWSKCSTTCGLGAVWRTVKCSTNEESHCENIKKPDPARRCHLRPCTTWKSGNWSKCSENCQGGTKSRDVQCIDAQTARQLRPFHCQPLGYKPPATLACNQESCLEWHQTPWSECSKSCGAGLLERLVYCPEYNRCNMKERPNSTEPCNIQPCTQWVTDVWEECTASCGGGVKHRIVKCVNEESKKVEDSSFCEEKTRPAALQKCNHHKCKNNKAPSCTKDSLSARFCEKLKLLGRCSLITIQRQCCLTCLHS
ncbi:A disintegrin and metalloproteinase with thrombospondin motifs 12 [Polyodon spathula]|uniref:A disintegrin and metalloproteinase with thrombospondin motifs 12 n=1 Tax=Polyodon spathula TaxID=7913 RepID=UPI001B7F0C49|nr:A disintegrin and metalloproteinase with thrombospondin motifs 12 [Polyodon spathula]